MENPVNIDNNSGGKMGHDEVYNLLVSRELSWQQMIYDLIKSEQLDPWDVDISKLTEKYLEKVNEMEELNYAVSAKVLLAAALLLRIKSEFLINHYIKSLDEILFGKPAKKEKPQIEINLDDVADLFPRTPLPRPKRVTLTELIGALNRAMVTEHRRIKNEITHKHALNRFNFFLPKNTVDVRFKLKEVYQKVKNYFASNKSAEKMTYTDLAPTTEEKRFSFGPVLHLDNQDRVLLEQLQHFDEIYIYLKNDKGSVEDVLKELKQKQKTYEERKIKEHIEDEMRDRFEEIEGIKKEANKQDKIVTSESE